MNRTEEVGVKLTDTQRAKLAYVYIRQSTLTQVRWNTESTTRQYELVERAMALGWPAARIQVIDEDLAKSGARSELRLGFQHLLYHFFIDLSIIYFQATKFAFLKAERIKSYPVSEAMPLAVSEFKTTSISLRSSSKVATVNQLNLSLTDCHTRSIGLTSGL